MRVTAREAAALLGVHYNTIRNRIKAGMYHAEKVHTENGPTWMIERDSLTDNAPTSAPQQPASGVSAAQEAAIQELARAIVREASVAKQSGSDQDAWVEGEKLLHDTVKTQALITAGLLGATGAAWFIPDSKHLGLLVGAVLLAISSLGLTLGHMYYIASDVRGLSLRWSYWNDIAGVFRHITDALSVVSFLAATVLLTLYISSNM